MSEADELLDVLDAEGNVIGRKTRALVHRDHDRHGLVFVWSAWESDGRQFMLLQRRSRADDPFGGSLDALAGGHIGAGESAVASACRELLEEVGLEVLPDDLVLLGCNHKDRPTGDCRHIVQHLLLYPKAPDLEDLSFSDEVDGFFRVDLLEFRSLVLGDRESVAALARTNAVEGLHEISLRRDVVTGYPDAILDTFRRSLNAIIEWLSDGRVDSAHFA